MSIVHGLLNQTIDYIYSVATNGYNDITQTKVYTDVPCRWQEGISQVVTPEAITKNYKVQAWISNDYTILYNYEISKSSEIYKIVYKECHYNIDGTLEYTKLYLV